MFIVEFLQQLFNGEFLMDLTMYAGIIIPVLVIEDKIEKLWRLCKQSKSAEELVRIQNKRKQLMNTARLLEEKRDLIKFQKARVRRTAREINALEEQLSAEIKDAKLLDIEIIQIKRNGRVG